MPRAITVPEKAILQTHGQWSKLYLAVHTPRVIYSAILASLPESTDMVYQLAFSDGVGTLADVLPDMTLYIGTTAGVYDLGMCRIRKAPIDGMLYINETSEIKWQAGCHLTVAEDYQIWQKPIRIVSNAPHMDVEIAYSDQHAAFDPVPILGSHIITKRTGDTVTVTAGPTDSTASWVIGSTIASVLWTAPTADSIDDPTAINPQITLSADGWHALYCAVTAANGKTFTGVRWVYVYSDEAPPVTAFTLKSCEGSQDSGGWSFNVEMVAQANIRDRALCILFSEDFADSQPVTPPSPHAERENILSIGWVSGESIERDSQMGTVEFKVEGAAHWLKKIPDFPVGLEFKTGSAAAWTDMPALTVDRALWHLFHWRSTLTRVIDIFPTDDVRYSAEFTTSAANLWERVNEIAQTSIFAAPGVDRLNRLHCQIEAQMTPEAERETYEVDTLTAQDWQGRIRWARKTVGELALLNFSGVAIGSDGGASAYFSLSPGHVHTHYGSPEQIERILLSGQSNSNALCGLYFGWHNNPFDSFEVNLAGQNRFIDCFPRQYIAVTIAPEDDPRGAGFTGRCLPRSMSISHNPTTGVIQTTVMLEPESFAGLSVNGDVIQSDGKPLELDLSVPSMPAFPPMPNLLGIIPKSPTVQTDESPKTVILWSSNFGILFSKNFDADNPTWYFMNNGLTSADYASIQNLVITPSGAIFIQTPYKVFAASGLGGTFAQIADVVADFNGGRINGLAVNPNVHEQIVITGSLHVNSVPKGRFVFASRTGLGSGAGVDQIRMYTSYAGLAYANNAWQIMGKGDFMFLDPVVWHFNALGIVTNGQSGTFIDGSRAGEDDYAVAAGTQDVIFHWNATGAFYKVTNGATVHTPISGTAFTRLQSMSPSPTGNFLMGGNWSGLLGYTVPVKSSDGGTTWGSAAGVIPVGSSVWENCGDDFRWIFGGGATLRLTMDFGASYVDKTASLLPVAPLVNISGIRFIS